MFALLFYFQAFLIKFAVNESIQHQAARNIIVGLFETINENGYFGNSKSTFDDKYFQTAHSDIQFKEYGSNIFHDLRSHAGISSEIYLESLNPNSLECISSDSKSGQAFWRSSNQLIILKTIKHYEAVNLKRILYKYANHMLSDTSCISAVLGIYRSKII